MTKKYYNEESVQDIADAIREKLGVETTYKIADMGDAVRSITGGSGNVDDVKVDGASVVQNKIANIELRKAVIGILYEYGLIKLDELTPEQINALETMDISINENGELITNFNNEVLNIEFNIVDNNLIVDSLENGIDFNINNKELEVNYNG